MKYQSDRYYSSELLKEQAIHHGFGTRDYVLQTPLAGPKTRQVHGSDIIVFDVVDPSRTYEADAFLTKNEGIVCSVRSADCLPLLIADPVRRWIGAVHCGWRGIAKRIVPKVLERLSKMGSDTGDMIALIGPHIAADCYEVGPDLVRAFHPDEWPVDELFHGIDGKTRFSLENAVLYELDRCGVIEDHIDTADLCTHCHPDRFYSYRRNRAEKGRQVNFILMSR